MKYADPIFELMKTGWRFESKGQTKLVSVQRVHSKRSWLHLWFRNSREAIEERFGLQEVFFTVSSPPGRMEGFRILGAELVAPERMLARVEITTRQGNEAVTELKRVPLIFVNGEWKWFVKNPADVHAIPFRERKE